MIWSAATGVYSGRVGERNVLFSTDDRRLHVLNGTAWSVWNALAVQRSLPALVSLVADQYGVPAASIESDVSMLVDTFFDVGLVVSDKDKGKKPYGQAAVGRTGDQEPTQILKGRSVSRVGLDSVRSSREGSGLIGPFSALGVPMTVQTADTFLHLELSRILSPLGEIADGVSVAEDREVHQHITIGSNSGLWCVHRNETLTARVRTRAAAIRAVVAECNSAPLPHIDDAVVFHAAAADIGGSIVMFPGVSNAGKSTLVTQLLVRGHSYLTDEATAVDLTSLQARPFTKSISIEPGSQPVVGSSLGRQHAGAVQRDRLSGTWDVDPRSIGHGRLSTGGAIAGVVFPTYAPELDPHLRPLEPVDALRSLLANAFAFEHIGQAAFDALVRVANNVPCYSMVHCGGEAHLDQLEVMFSADSAISL